MSALGLLLLAIGVGDIVAGGLAGQVSSLRRALFALLAGAGTAGGMALLAGFDLWTTGRLCAISTVALAAWVLPRARTIRPKTRPCTLTLT